MRRRQDFRDEYRMGVCQFCRCAGCGLPSSANLWALLVIVEHNGDVYACDHGASSAISAGKDALENNCRNYSSPQQQVFGEDKFKQLPAQCRSCNVLKACWGGCPKHRFMLDASGKPGLNYLCAGYQRYFRHLPPYLKAMADLLAHGRPASDIMHAHLLVVSK
ncbi:SPASM domain-containing protein [Escherichia coli]